MKNKTIIGPDGVIWKRSEDGKRLDSADGRVIYAHPSMENEYLLTFAYPIDTESLIDTE